MSLIRAEWKRFFARRFIRIMLGVVLILFALIAVGLAHDSHQVSPADVAVAQQHVADANAQQQSLLTQCQQAQTSGNVDPGSQFFLPPGATCDNMFGGGPAQVEWFLPNTWNFADEAPQMLLVFSGLFALFAFATGASYIGAEWSSGGMMNLMLWRPKRLSLLGQKLIALLTAELVVGIVLGAIWVGSLVLVAATRGTFGHVTSGVIQSMLLYGARLLTLGLFASCIGFALGSIGRHTAAALGAAVGYVIVVEIAGRLVMGALDVVRPQRFLLSQYVLAWTEKTQSFYNGGVCRIQGGVTVCEPDGQWVMRAPSAAEVLGIALVVVLGWAFISFRRRDV